MPDDKTKLYLEYLDKEMTIMGILSTFAVAAVSFVLNKFLSVEDNKQILLLDVWTHGSSYIIAASALMLISALYFYRQRSLLAWHYGQICLCLNRKPSEVRKFLDDADSWETWIHYKWAFGFLFLALGEYLSALATTTSSGNWLEAHWLLCTFAPFILVFSILLVLRRVLKQHKYDDEPFRAWWGKLTRNAK
jgi:hypothetical protein